MVLYHQFLSSLVIATVAVTTQSTHMCAALLPSLEKTVSKALQTIHFFELYSVHVNLCFPQLRLVKTR